MAREPHEPSPIPESVTYDGQNEWQVIDWANRTFEHYEQPALFGHAATAEHMRLTDHYNQVTVTARKGQAFTYNERIGLCLHGGGPEILARDHAPTVAERMQVFAEQERRGITPASAQQALNTPAGRYTAGPGTSPAPGVTPPRIRPT